MELDIGFSTFQLAAIFATYLVAASVKGVTGLGFSTVCLPLLALSVGLKDALPLVIIPSVCSNVVVMVGAGHFVSTVKRFRLMLAMTVPGILLGLWVLYLIDGELAGAVLGVVLIAFCLFSYTNPDFRLPQKLEAALGPVSGFLTGLVNGVTGSQVMPSMPYLMSLNLKRDVFVQAINCSFTLSSLIMALGLAKLGLLTLPVIVVSAAGVAVAFFGLRLGEKLRNRLSTDQFRNAVLGILVVMAVILIARVI